MSNETISNLDLKAIYLETEAGDIYGLFSEYRLKDAVLPKGLIAYGVRHSDDDDSVPSTIEPSATVNYFGSLIVDRPLDFAVDGLLLVAKRRSSLLADQLFGHDEPHDVVVAPAESPSQFLLPAAHAVAVAEDFERPDVDRRIGHERTVHVEYGAFYHMIPYFKPQR